MKRRQEEMVEGQGLSSLVGILNRIRQISLQKNLDMLSERKEAAFGMLRNTEESINKVISSGRGGITGVHGFIGEHAQCGISNARSLMGGRIPLYKLIDDNGPIDYFRGTTPIQQKACQADGVLGLKHVLRHKEAYPEFQGIYQIPKDFYETFARFRDMPKSEAGKMLRPDYRLWQKIQAFLMDYPDVQIEPMVVDYAEIQMNEIGNTLAREREALLNLDKKKRAAAVAKSRATIAEGVKVAACSAAIEGVASAGISTMHHLENGRSLKELDSKDWKEIGTDTLVGAGKGAIRGGAVYAITNCTRISAPTAGAIVSAAISTVESTSEYLDGEITGKECVEKVAESCIDAAVCAAFAKVGTKIIRNPILGSIAGGTIGMVTCYFLKNPKKENVVAA